MYDRFSLDYDRFVDWPGRLNFEIPFLLTQITKSRATQNIASLPVLDAACGTGWHAIALAQRGYATAGADLSAPMIERARHNAAECRCGCALRARRIRRPVAALLGKARSAPCSAWATLYPTCSPQPACRLRWSTSPAAWRRAGCSSCRIATSTWCWQTASAGWSLQSHREGDAEWLFLRFYDFDPDSLISFNILSLQRQGEASWTQQLHTTRLRPLLQDELGAALHEAGFGEAGGLWQPGRGGV